MLDLAGTPQARWHFADQTVQVRPALLGFGEVIHAAAVQGMGIARLATFLIRPDLEAGRLVPLLDGFLPPSDRGIYAFAPRQGPTGRKAQAFLELLSGG